MHWTLPDLYALTRNQYDALVEWLRDMQTPDGEAEDRWQSTPHF